MHETLTLQDAVRLATVVRWAQSNTKVMWAVDSNSDRILTGVVRSIGDENGNFLRADEDVRNSYVRITSTFEFFLPMPDVVAMVRRCEMVEAD